MFASQTTETIQIGDVAVTIRKLSWKTLRHAAQAQLDQQLGFALKAGADVLRAIETAGAKAPESTVSMEQTRLARYASHDRAIVLQAGVKSWTATQPLPKGLDDLEEEAADTLHRAILDLSLPDPAQEEAARKNA
jgi:hypothetical protein